MSTPRRIPRRGVLAIALLWLLALGIGTAFAIGTLTYKRREISESSNGWHLAMTITLPQPPATPHQVMKFSFTPTSYYERYLDDAHGDKPQFRKQPLIGQKPILESVDVDFSDASGKVFNRTIFDFTITRSHNFSAGEYQVSVHRADGAQVGNTQTLTLLGDNPVIDRRAISFVDSKTGDKTSEKKKAGAAAPAASSAPAKAAEPPKDKEQEPAAAGSSEDNAAAGPSEENAAPDTANAEKVPPSSRGCGCSVPGAKGSARAAWGLAIGLGLLASRRRRTEDREAGR